MAPQNKTKAKRAIELTGYPMLELQANPVNTLANIQIPGTNPWIAVIDWLNARPRVRLSAWLIQDDCGKQLARLPRSQTGFTGQVHHAAALEEPNFSALDRY